MSRIGEHRFTFPVVRPIETVAPIKGAPPMSQQQLVEQSLLRCPTRDGRRLGSGQR